MTQINIVVVVFIGGFLFGWAVCHFTGRQNLKPAVAPVKQHTKNTVAASDVAPEKDPSEWEDKDWFDHFGNLHLPWVMHGDQLLASARLIRQESERLRQKRKTGLRLTDEEHIKEEAVLVAFLLYGYSVENYLKAILLKRGHKLFQQGKMVDRPGFSSHDLNQMARYLKLSLTGEESKVLKDLSGKVNSTARYPTEKKWMPGQDNRSFKLKDLDIVEEIITFKFAELKVNPGQYRLKPEGES